MNKEEIGNISIPNVSTNDLVMISIENSEEGMRKCDEIILNHQLLDDTKIETHGICIQENVDIEFEDLQLMKGKINMSERQRLQDEVEMPSILQ